MPIPEPLSHTDLYNRCDPESLSFKSTKELDEAITVSGQDRAHEAIRFGVGMKHQGFNIFALGPAGTGKQTALENYLEQKATDEPVPLDWCYVYNFADMRRPMAISLPAGDACGFRDAMEQLLEGLLTVVPGAFSSEEYQEQEKNIKEEFAERQASEIEKLEKIASEKNIALIRTPSGFAFAPVKKGEVVNAEEFMRLKSAEKEAIEKEIGTLKESMQSIMKQIPKWQRETRKKLKELNRQVAAFAVKPLFSELKNTYKDHKAIAGYLDDVEKDAVEHFGQFLEKDHDKQQTPISPLQGKETDSRRFNPYRVNVVIDNCKTQGAPVIYEDKPSIQNLVGDIEHLAQMGTLVTDFTLIKAGALHRANGGYLILNARRLMMEPLAYEALKKAIRTRQIRIESLAQLYGMASTLSLDPEPIPLDTKIILLGERRLYYLLSAHDPDFNELFKVAADFDDDMERDHDAHLFYAAFISSIIRQEKLRHMDASAVARVIEYGSRLSGDSSKLSTHIQSITDLVNESGYYADENNNDLITHGDVQQAIDARRYRAGRVPEKIEDAILQNTILIDTESEKVGQINGLSVYTLGNQSFGKPSRITTRIKMGKGEVVDIEREVDMGGPLHSKGVLILNGFLGGRFGQDQPLSLSATLVFEQSYGEVDGDSASSAELYALLSAISARPVKQCFAVTGSVNQYGGVQAIGGVNEKIEGFFDLCLKRGLTGKQGVLIPASNTRNLMLREDVRDAVRENRFFIYPVNHVDEGIEILTGIPAGRKQDDGSYPDDSINGLAVRTLKAMAEKQKKQKENSNTDNENT